MKALVLSGGLGTRLRPITYSFAKQLIPVANKPILFYVLDDIAAAGIKQVGLVVGETGPLIREAVGNGARWGLEVEYIVQEAPLGLAHAVKIARPILGDGPFVMYLGDNLIKGGIKPLVDEYGNKGEDISILLTEVNHPEQFGVAVLNEGGGVKCLVEKPSHYLSNLALVGIYIFNSKIFTAVEAIQPSWRGELEITDAIQYVINQGGRVEPHLIKGWWKDTGKKADVLEANRLILEELTSLNKGMVNQGSRVSGRVKIDCGSLIRDSVLEGPVIIGRDCLIENSYLGPYTAIGDQVQISNSEIEQSIVMEITLIENITDRIANSLIGRNVSIKGCRGRPGVHDLLLGDQSSLILYE